MAAASALRPAVRTIFLLAGGLARLAQLTCGPRVVSVLITKARWLIAGSALAMHAPPSGTLRPR